MVRLAVLAYITEKKYDKRYAEKLRGYFANHYREEDIFHNHAENKKSIYRMPLIQYKVIGGSLTIIGINKGADLVAGVFMKHNEIRLGDEILSGFEKELTIREEDLFVDEELHSYRFESIWLALNQENYKRYLKGEVDLDKVLINNLISNFKGCGVEADKRIMVKGKYRQVETVMKDNEMVGFVGSFVTNVKMPEYLGVGKRRAIGYGVVVEER